MRHGPEKRKTKTAGRRKNTNLRQIQPSGTETESQETQEQIPLPEVNFATFVFSLSTSALMNLGELPDPQTRQVSKNLPLAKQTIDILGMLKEKPRVTLMARRRISLAICCTSFE